MLPDVDGYVLWLLPDHKSAAYASSVIQMLAEKYQSGIFLPHITLARVPDWNLPRLKRAVTWLAEETPPFNLQIETVKCGNNPYQKITAAIQKTNQLNNLFDAADSLLGGRYSNRDYPHLSFLYSTIHCSQCKEVVKSLNQKRHPILKIQQLVLVSLEGAPDEWTVVYGKHLKTNVQE